MVPTFSTVTLNISEQAERPFRYFLAKRCLNAALEQKLLTWLETDAPWRLVTTDFYEQYEFSLFEANLPTSLKSIVSPDILLRVRKTMERAFQCKTASRVNLVAHKLVPGQQIAIHNDYLVGQETHRLTIQINRDMRDGNGGFFILFDSDDVSDVHRVLRPISGSAIGFEISPDSYHAVSRVQGGERFTLIYSFYADT